MSWVVTGRSAGNEKLTERPPEWSCDYCTLFNPPSSTTCSVCLNPRKYTAHSRIDPGIPSVQDKHACHSSDLSPSTVKDTLTTHSKSDLSLSTIYTEQSTALTVIKNPQSVPYRNKIQNVPMSNPYKRKWVDSASGVGPTAKRPATSTITPASATHSKAPAKSNKTQGATDPSDGNQSKIPLCPTHRRRCNMKEVRKEGPNLGRWFFSCVVRACTFFQVRGQSF